MRIASGKAPRAPPADAVDVRKGKRRIATAVEAYDGAVDFLTRARHFSRERHFLHWEAAFPGVWSDWERLVPPGGFDAVIGNPPWDRMKMQEAEWFAARVPEIARTDSAAQRGRLAQELLAAGGELADAYESAEETAESAMRVAREYGAYPLLSGGDINLYSLFVERALSLLKPSGISGLIVPSGIAADLGAARFFRMITTANRLGLLFDFENRPVGAEKKKFFPDVYYRFKFSAIVVGGEERHFDTADCAFFQTDVDEAVANSFAIRPAEFAVVNPNTGTAAIFRTSADAQLTLSIYRRMPVLVDRRSGKPAFLWPFRYTRMMDMANDSSKFVTAADLTKAGAYPVAGRRWERGSDAWVPLYEGKTVQAYDHRAASVAMTSGNRYREALSVPATEEQHGDPTWGPVPQFWVSETEIDLPPDLPAVLAFKDISSPTNIRGLIATMIPRAPAGHTLPLLLPAVPEAVPGSVAGSSQRIAANIADYARWAPLLLANFNSFALDYVARLKLQGNHFTLYILEQLPLVPPGAYARRFGPRTVGDIIRQDVLHLTYTAHDMAPFARDQGYTGPPFPWDEEDRLHRRARLDAVFFHLYGLDRDQASYILSTFPILQREEEARYQGRFRSRDLILAYMAALAAGAPDANVAG